jgi:hypothetical protein
MQPSSRNFKLLCISRSMYQVISGGSNVAPGKGEGGCIEGDLY